MNSQDFGCCYSYCFIITDITILRILTSVGENNGNSSSWHYSKASSLLTSNIHCNVMRSCPRASKSESWDLRPGGLGLEFVLLHTCYPNSVNWEDIPEVKMVKY